MEKTRSHNLLSSRGAICADYPLQDWSSTALGHPDAWPALLRHAVNLMLESQFPMFIAWGPEFTFLYNAPYIPLMDSRHPSALGTPLSQVWPEFWVSVQPLIDSALGGEPTFGEDIARVICREGHPQECWFTLSYSPILDDNGIVAGVLCIINETTARVRLERRQALQIQLVDSFRQLSSEEDITKVASDLLGHYLDVPHVFYAQVHESLGYFEVKRDWSRDAAETMAGQRGRPDDFGPEVISLLSSGQPVTVADIQTDGRTAAHAASYATLGVRAVLALPLVKDGALIATLNVYDSKPRHWSEEDRILAADIAERTWNAVERVRAEAALRESAARQAALLAMGEFQLQIADALRKLSDPGQIFSTTSELLGQFLKVSRVLCGEYDLEKKIVTYHSNYTDGTVSELNGTYPTASFGNENFASLESGKTWISEDMAHDPRTCGAETWPTFEAAVIYSAVVVPLSRHSTLIACLFINDSKPRQWSADEVRLIENAAERTWNAVERVRAEEALRQADRRKDEFLAMLAHELRNPLAPISAAAQLLRVASLAPERIGRTSDIIARQVEHMTGLIDDLLDVSRVTRGLVVLDKEEVDIKHVVTDAVEQVRPLIEARHQHFVVHTAPGAAFVQGDYKRLVQVMANLLNNAAKYTPESGELSVWMGTSDDQVVLSVSDTGIGIPAELLPKIFDLFSQAQRTSDRSQGGLGLGLALVKSLVELHDGNVSVSSGGQGAGSEFTVRLPRLFKKAEPAASHSPTFPSYFPLASRPLQVLVVDDNVDAAQMIAMFLEAAGYQVTVVYDPKDALVHAEQSAFDAYLLDIGLPGMDGNELARRLRAMAQSRTVLLIAITGYGQQFDKETSKEAGFDHYLVKPADPMKLVSLLSNVPAA